MARLMGETGDSGGASRPPESPRVWMIRLPFDRPPLTYNELKGKHWATVDADRKALNAAGFYLSRSRQAMVPAFQYAGVVDLDLSAPERAVLPRPFPGPVTVELIYWPGNNTVHDGDNMHPTLKYLVDGMRKAGVFTDDRGRYVRTSSCTVVELDDDPERNTTARMALVIREL